MKAILAFLIIFLVAIFARTNFVLAADSGNIANLEVSYNVALQNLVILLQKQVVALSNQLQSLSAPTSTSSIIPTSTASSSAPAKNYSGSLFNYYPTWHLVPGSCFPQLY